MQDKNRKAMWAKGAEPTKERYFDQDWNDHSTNYRCQKCGGLSSSLKEFEAHKKTHPNFDNEHHYKIHQQLQANPQYRLRRHHKLGSHDKYCDGSDKNCQMSHLGKYNGKTYKPFT